MESFASGSRRCPLRPQFLAPPEIEDEHWGGRSGKAPVFVEATLRCIAMRPLPQFFKRIWTTPSLQSSHPFTAMQDKQHQLRCIGLTDGMIETVAGERLPMFYFICTTSFPSNEASHYGYLNVVTFASLFQSRYHLSLRQAPSLTLAMATLAPSAFTPSTMAFLPLSPLRGLVAFTLLLVSCHFDPATIMPITVVNASLLSCHFRKIYMGVVQGLDKGMMNRGGDEIANDDKIKAINIKNGGEKSDYDEAKMMEPRGDGEEIEIVREPKEASFRLPATFSTLAHLDLHL
ncbi:hypothetical protein OPV22_025957 [Ensete ventricosum]|uniref:Uncharacterized protein n=1 Tax=Ensete ventricosum TaxID=4639 RepID=A0AAV8Q557_ENSVE|nr:hypothetical protein OPV22_025957 [Ensete ventricosum]